MTEWKELCTKLCNDLKPLRFGEVCDGLEYAAKSGDPTDILVAIAPIQLMLEGALAVLNDGTAKFHQCKQAQMDALALFMAICAVNGALDIDESQVVCDTGI